MTAKFLSFLAVAALSGAFVSAPALADAKFDQASKKEIETIVHDYIMNNPQVILDTVNAYQEKKQADAEAQQASNLKNYKSYLLGPDMPSTGNQQGDVTVVEFFDYNCGYCKRALPDVKKVLKEDKDLRFIFADIPILGPSSELAAKWALASRKQGKYFEYHVALMEHNGPKTEDVLESLAKDVGLDAEKLKKDAQDPEIEKKIAKDLDVAQQLGINGTPAFIINDDIHRGYIGLDALRQGIKDARAAKKDKGGKAD